MGKCSYCGDNVGFLRSKHQRCHNAHKNGLDKIKEIAMNAAVGDDNGFTNRVAVIARRSYIAPDALEEAISMGWCDAVERSLTTSGLTSDMENLIVSFSERYVNTDSPAITRAWSHIVLGVAIRELAEGKRPSYQYPNITFAPIVFEESETPIWAINEIELWEERTVQVRHINYPPPYRPMPPSGHVRYLGSDVRSDDGTHRYDNTQSAHVC